MRRRYCITLLLAKIQNLGHFEKLSQNIFCVVCSKQQQIEIIVLNVLSTEPRNTCISILFTISFKYNININNELYTINTYYVLNYIVNIHLFYTIVKTILFNNPFTSTPEFTYWYFGILELVVILESITIHSFSRV